MTKPLDDLRVLDCGRWITAPICARILADLGADVIKIEVRGRPDAMRGILDLGEAEDAEDGTPAPVASATFDVCNRGKRGIALDITKPRGRDIFHQLVTQADVLVQNWQESTAASLGADYATLARCNPGLIYAACSGWGPEGPEAGEPAMDAAALARSGMMYLWGSPDMPPVSYVGGLADQTAGMVMVEGILAALHARQRTGLGQRVDVSLLGSMIALEAIHVQDQLVRGHVEERRDRARSMNPLASYYRCADGKWLTLSMYQADRYWPSLCRALGVPDLESDARFSDMMVRAKNSAELITIIDRVFASRPRAEWARLLSDHGLIFAPVQTMSEVVSDPQVLANDYTVEFDHSEWGRARVLGFPYRFSAMPLALGRQAPEFGQHTEEILLELGYTWDDITALKDEEAV